MKASSRALTALLLLVLPIAAFAANGDTINIGGQVPLLLNLTVTADVDADNLPLTTTGADTPVTEAIATIDVATNNTAGWELWVFSANAVGVSTSLINADLDPIAYTITYSGASGVTAANIPAVGLKVGEDAANADQTAETLSVNYTQSAGHPAGYYSDQLSIVLRAK